MPRKQVYTKSQIPKWYRRRIKGFEELSDIDVVYEYERIKLEERIRRAKKKGFQYNLESRIPRGQRTAYDIAEVEAITSADIRKVQVNNRVEEADYWLSQLEDYVETTSEEIAQGWIEAKRYKSRNRGGVSRSGAWLANNTREAGRRLNRAIETVRADASKVPKVYEYYLVGSKYQQTAQRIEKILADSDTATGRYNLLNAFISEFTLTPMGVKEGMQDDSLTEEGDDAFDNDYE